MTARAYVAVRFPQPHVVFRMLFDRVTFTERPVDAYEALSERVQTSVREALAEMGVRVVEKTDEARADLPIGESATQNTTGGQSGENT